MTARRGGAAAARRPTRRVKVELGERSYCIRLGEGTLGGLGAAIARETGARRAAVVTVPAVGRRYGGSVLRLGGHGAGSHRLAAHGRAQ